MLLEQLVKQAAQPPQYDWDAYYRWFFSTLTGQEISSFDFWQCPHCLAINFFLSAQRYGKCRGCDLIYLP